MIFHTIAFNRDDIDRVLIGWANAKVAGKNETEAFQEWVNKIIEEKLLSSPALTGYISQDGMSFTWHIGTSAKKFETGEHNACGRIVDIKIVEGLKK